MTNLIPFIVVGVVSGSVYGMAASGLVLTYKTSGIFNLAYGSVAAIGASVFYWLWVEESVPWPVAALLVLLVVAPASGLALERLAYRLAQANVVLKVVATIGLILLITNVATIIFGPTARTVPPFISQTPLFSISGVPVNTSDLVLLGVGLGAVVILHLFLEHTSLGTATRAVVDNPELLNIGGTNPARVRRWAWIIGSCFAMLAGILLLPSTNLDLILLTLLVVQAFGAAVIGRFSSLPMTYAGGVLIGVAASIATNYVSGTGWTAGLPASLPFLVLFVGLLVIPARLLGGGNLERYRRVITQSAGWRAPTRVRVGGYLLVGALLAVVPLFAGTNQIIWTQGLTYVILFLSLGMLVETSGQVSLCQIAFAAIGASSLSHFAVGFGLPWLPAVLLAGLAAVPMGALIAIPAARLPPLFLALATFGFGIVVQDWGYSTSWMFGNSGQGGLRDPRPSLWGSWLSSDTGYYYVVLVFVVATFAAIVGLNRTRFGRLLRAMRDSPISLATAGTSVAVTRIIVLCIAAFLAGIARALQGSTYVYINSGVFDSFVSLTLLALLVVQAGAMPWAALGGAAALGIIPGYLNLSGNGLYALQALFGAAALATAWTLQRYLGVPPWMQHLLDRLGKPDRRKATMSARSHQTEQPRTSPEARDSRAAAGHGGAAEPGEIESGLIVTGLTVRYGGVVAVDDVSFTIPLGRITGLIGPNGAGKSSAFNACSGLTRARSGRIRLTGTEVSRFPPAARARLGLGRTFQVMEFCESLTVYENVEIGAEAALAGANPLRHLFGRRHDRAAIAASVETALQTCELGHLRDVHVMSLSTGQRRLVDLARCLAGRAKVLLLDEPSSGLDTVEKVQFMAIVRDIVARRGCGIMLVEHDMGLVMDACSYIYVLDFGQLVFEGTPQAVAASAAVQAAYLGSVPGTVSADSATGQPGAPDHCSAPDEPGARDVSDVTVESAGGHA